MKKIIDKIKELEKTGISNINLIAFVTKSSSEVVFYGTIDGIRYQSNNMVEEDKIDSGDLDAFYGDIAKIIREDKKFDESTMTIVKASDKECKVELSEKKTSTYKLLKEWEKGVQQ